MDKKKTKVKGKDTVQLRPVTKSGDATEVVHELGKAKALEDIHKIFAEVGREYPEFLEDTEADEQQYGGDGNILTPINIDKRERKVQPMELMHDLEHSRSLATGQKILGKSEIATTVKKGVSFQGVSNSAGHHKQVKTTTLVRDGKKLIPSRMGGLPAPKPKQTLGPMKSIPTKVAKEKSILVEIFSNKAEFGFPLPNTSVDTFPSSTDITDLPSTTNSDSTTGILAEIVQNAKTEAELEISGPYFEKKKNLNYNEHSNLSTKTPIKKKLLPQDHESRLISTKSRVHKLSPLPKPIYMPIQDRLTTVPENIQHDDFATEFIQGFEIKPEKFEQALNKQSNVPDYLPHDGITTSTVKPPPPMDEINSLKLVHKYPIWPHQSSLHKILNHLPALKSVILDDSDITWLRDLGSFLPNLITLSVMRCQLSSLDGTFGFPNLENLFAADNQIKSPSHLSCLEHIRFIDLSGNKIDSFEGFQYLHGCLNLKCLKLTDNEIGNLPYFHEEMRRLIPSIRDLHPKSTYFHEIDILDDNHNETWIPPKNPETEKWYEYKSKGNSNASFADDISAIVSSTKKENSKKVTWKLDYRGTDLQPEDKLKEEDENETDLNKEIDSVNEELEWRVEEKRLREVYIPGREEFKKRGPSVVPIGIDEMDALLDQLEITNDLKPIKSAISTNYDSMTSIEPLTSFLDENMTSTSISIVTQDNSSEE